MVKSINDKIIDSYVYSSFKSGFYSSSEQSYITNRDGFLIALQVASPGAAAGYCKINGNDIAATGDSSSVGRNSIAAEFVRNGNVIK